MNNLIIKNQIIFLAMLLFLAMFCILGINTARAFVDNVQLSVETGRITDPLKKFYDYRLAIAERDNQTILQTIIAPKNNVYSTSNKITNSVPVLVYHGVVSEADGKNTTVEQIKNQLYTLHQAGYKTVSIEDYQLFLEGKKQLAEKSFLLTFDDGRKDSLKIDPVLKALDYQAVMFVIVEQLNKDSQYYLSVNELKAMQKSKRWSIQSHGKSAHDQFAIDDKGTKANFYSNKLWLTDKNRLETTEEFTARVEKDLKDAKSDLEKLGFSIQAIAFPFGDFGQFSNNFPGGQYIIADLVSKTYPLAFYQIYKQVNDDYTTQNYFGSEKTFAKRITADPDLNGVELVQLMEAGNAKELPFKDNFTNPYNWTAEWGQVVNENGQLMINSTFETNGSSAFLKGSNHWKNYRIDASVQWLMGNTFSILTRVANSTNYVSCDFSDGQAEIKTKINGELKVLVSKKMKEVVDPANSKLSVIVNEDFVSCLINDKEVVGTTTQKNLNNQLSSGGIGFSTWDSIEGNSAIIISNLQVVELQ